MSNLHKQMSDEAIHLGISKDIDAAPILDEAWFKNATLVKPRKKMVCLRLDPSVLNFFKASGKGYQTRINQVLKAYVKAHN